jgi:penicillin-binding protein 2
VFPDDAERRVRGTRLSIAFLLLLFVLAARLFHMQVLGADYWESRSRDNRVRPERTKALSGLIQDRDGVALATNRPSLSIAVIPYQVRARPDVIERLAPLIDVPVETIRKTLADGASHPYDELRVRRDVDVATVARVEERRLDLPGVAVISEPVREYPFGATACHALGYVGEISRDELAKQAGSPAYQAGDEIGRAGVEKTYERVLRGTDGTRYLLEDALGRQLEQIGEDPARPGNSIVLTLDLDLQAVADSALSGWTAGAVVAIDPRTGAVLALASRPGFDPNVFSGGISAAEWGRLNNDPTFPLINRVVQAAYSPGSTYKVVTAAAGLETRVITRHTVFRSCFGGYQFGKRFFGCWEAAGHGQLALEGSIIHSCNTYFYQVGERLDLAAFAAMGARFGFGGVTGVDLPQEVKGLAPGPAYYDKRFGEHGWTQGVLLNLAIGQGEMLATPIQLAVCYGAVATQGTLVTPHLLDRIETWEGGVVEIARTRATPVQLGRETWEALREALPKVVESGTGGGAKLPSVRVAGKTGTAQNPHGNEHAWFVSYAPADAAELVVAIILEQGGHGGAVAAPIARRLYETHFGTTVAMGGN